MATTQLKMRSIISLQEVHYVDLNDPYLVMNTQRLEEAHSDYLAMLCPPDMEHLFSLHEYVNDEIHVGASANSDRKHKNSNGEAASDPELLLMYTRSKLESKTPNFTGSPSSYSKPDLPHSNQHQGEDQR